MQNIDALTSLNTIPFKHKEVKPGDTIEMIADGGMFKKGDRYKVGEVDEQKRFFYYCGTLALSMQDPRYIIVCKNLEQAM